MQSAENDAISVCAFSITPFPLGDRHRAAHGSGAKSGDNSE